MTELDQIHEEDCFKALTTIDDQSIDVVLTDPPYPNRAGAFTESLVDGLAALYLCCKKAKKYVAFFWNPFEVPPPPPGWHEVARHVWWKPDTRTLTTYEVIVVWSQDPKRKMSRVWNIPLVDLRSLHDFRNHPTQKPVRLVRYLLEQLTNEGETVLDPFLGSGTTAVACQQMKRHYIGIEKNHDFATIARERITKKPKEDDEPEPATTTPPSDDQKESPGPKE